MPQVTKIPDAKAAVGKGMEKARDDPSVEFGKVKSKTEVILEAQRDKQKVHASLMDICHLKNAELEPTFQKYKGRVVLRDDIVKTTLEPTQFLLTRARLRPKWLPQK